MVAAGSAQPRVQQLAGAGEGLEFGVPHLVLVLELTPRQFLVQQLQQNEEKAPQIILAAQFFLKVGCETRVWDRASEFRLRACGEHFAPRVEVLLREAEVNQV